MNCNKLGTSAGMFAVAFVYVLLTGVFVQFLVLPYLFPELHAGDGLLKGMDTVDFHHQALKLLAQMNIKGWSVWSLRPDGMNSPPGIMAVMYYLLVPKPYVLLLLNGLLWGITAATWFAILTRIFPENGKWSAVAVLLIIILPSSWQWTTQFLKDTISIAGFSLVFFAFIQSVVMRDKDDIAKWLRHVGVPLLFGGALIWLVRPYILQLLVAGSFSALVVVCLAFLLRRVPPRLVMTTTAVAVVTLLLSLEGNYIFLVNDQRHDRLTLKMPSSSSSSSSFLDNGVFRLQTIRDGYCLTKDRVGSSIDCDVKMSNVADAIAYLPRALQIGLLSPFPSSWFAKAKTPGGGQMRMIAGGEMLIAYLIFSSTLMLLIRRKVRLSLPLLMGVVYLLIPLLIETYANPEVGTLYRMRYIFWTGLMAMSLSLSMSYFLIFKKTGKVTAHNHMMRRVKHA